MNELYTVVVLYLCSHVF